MARQAGEVIPVIPEQLGETVAVRVCCVCDRFLGLEHWPPSKDRVVLSHGLCRRCAGWRPTGETLLIGLAVGAAVFGGVWALFSLARVIFQW